MRLAADDLDLWCPGLFGVRVEYFFGVTIESQNSRDMVHGYESVQVEGASANGRVEISSSLTSFSLGLFEDRGETPYKLRWVSLFPFSNLVSL